MQIRTLKAYRYRNCNIYFRNFGEICEYLVVIKGEVYTAHMRVRKSLFQRLLRRDYTEQQTAGIIKYLSRIAETTVDTALEKYKR